MLTKVPYICSALTELPIETRDEVKSFLSALGDSCKEVLGNRAFVPHEHYDPVKFAHFEDVDVFDAEHKQITQNTSLVIVVCIAPSWGGGAEIALAGESRIPVLFLCPAGKKISRYITGLAKRKKVFQNILYYVDYPDALQLLEEWLITGGWELPLVTV